MLTKNKIIIPFFSVGKFGLFREVAIKWRVRREIQGLYWERESSFSTKNEYYKRKVLRKIKTCRLFNAIRWINLYPVDNAVNFVNTYPLDGNLSVG